MPTVEFDGNSVMLNEVKEKISLLRSLELDVYFVHIVDRAENDMKETVELANQLRDLEDDEYLSVMDQALAVINEELEGVMDRQRNIIRSQLTSLNEKYSHSDTEKS